ncbi:type VII secretion protein EccB [Halopolyspora algeriensis]|uniref:Type VII secretion protein EccB n=1 Tax=Halopolyspora algeriensis TaxID=1500506 RepID=A0A368VZD6_9ACTN|nr:type VII secretion protein EccB [Halopolyspora algeriensis]RCW46742.1 type VII secretion protein EccB [Halopolyspora algeriensis]
MASTPTTKSQVQAYKFVLRRMESALARRDPVMLHDPLGSHKRANIAGAVIACVGMIGFLVWGLFGGQGSVPGPGSVVIARESGSVYVVTADDKADKRLIPMLNMASAKLLVMAKSDGGRSQEIEPTRVREAALEEFPRGPRTGMPNAPEFLPDANNPASAAWAVCDVGDVNTKLDDALAQRSATVETTVIGGDSGHGTELRKERSLYVQEPSTGQRYLIYRIEDMPGTGRDHTRAVKARIDPDEDAVMEMYGLRGAVPRTISTNMLNAIPEVPPLMVPELGSGPVGYLEGDYEVGDVVSRVVPGQDDQFFVLRSDGKQEISAGAAAVLHAKRDSSTDIPVPTGELTGVPTAAEELLPVGHFPTVVPDPVTFQESNTSCLSWKGEFGNHHITVTLHDGSPTQQAPVKLAQFDGPGPRVDRFYMPPGKAAVVHGTPNEASSGSGPISMVSDRGVVFGVKDVATARGLGIINNAGDIKDAPPSILGILPQGAFLDPARASFVYDSLPMEDGAGVNRPPKEDRQSRSPEAAAAGS